MSRLRAHDRGSAAIELLGVIPIVVMVILAILQGAAATFATQATNQAVRDGARALSMGQSAEIAVEQSLPGGLRAERITYVSGGQGIRLEVKVPRIGVFPALTVDRTAVMPRVAP
jgi:Flp pilus assembly protein TadG